MSENKAERIANKYLKYEMGHGKPQKQAIAIALEKAREAKRRAGKWLGGRVAPDEQSWDLEEPMIKRPDTSGEPHVEERKALDFHNQGSDAPAGMEYHYHMSAEYKSPVLEHLGHTDVTDKYDPEDEMSIVQALKKRKMG